MKFKIDENLPVEVAALLEKAGYDTMTILQQQLGGKPDDSIGVICQQENRIIVTLDLDFADIRAYPPQEQAGLIVLRLKQQDKFYVLAIFERLIKYLQSASPKNQLWIVSEHRIRIRE